MPVLSKWLTMPKNIDEENNQNLSLSIDSIPKYFDVVGNNPYVKYETFFKAGEEKYIVVLNHDSLAVFKE